jgi:hypothetical protein
MSTRAAAWLAWSLGGLSLVMFLASFVLYFLLRAAQVPGGRGTDLSVGGLLGYGLFLVFPLVGALIASRRPENAIGWICLAVGLLWMFIGVSDFYGVYGVARPGSVPFPVVVAGINNWLWVPAVGLLGTYLLLLFPDGRLPSSRWRPLAWLSGAVLVSASVGVMLSPGPLQGLGAQPLRAGRTALLADECGVCSSPAIAALHAGLGPEPGAALPAFQRRGAPAGQVDSVFRLGGCRRVPNYHWWPPYSPRQRPGSPEAHQHG